MPIYIYLQRIQEGHKKLKMAQNTYFQNFGSSTPTELNDGTSTKWESAKVAAGIYLRLPSVSYKFKSKSRKSIIYQIKASPVSPADNPYN